MSDEQQLSRVPAVPIDWQTRAVEALRTVKEQHLALAHEVAANGELRSQIAALRVEADRREASYRELAESLAAQEDRDDAACARVGIPPHGCDTSDMLADEVLALRATLARVRDLAQRHANLSVSNGSWQMASRHCGAQILKALEDK